MSAWDTGDMAAALPTEQPSFGGDQTTGGDKNLGGDEIPGNGEVLNTVLGGENQC